MKAALATAILFAVTAMVLLGCATGDPIIDTMGEGLCTAGVVAIGMASLNPFAAAGLDLCYPR